MVRWRLIKQFIKLCCYLILLLIIVCTIFALYGFFICSKNNHKDPVHISSGADQPAIQHYARPMSSSFMIYPEWYIVYSSTEYAKYLKTNLPSGFPYFSSIEQYWCGYGTVYHLARNYPFNFDDNLMLVVIGMSLTAEYVIKGVYENTIGRLTEILSDGQPVEEDEYAQRTAQAYADFIPYKPWFEFSFSKSLVGLWCETSFVGPHMIRKWERKMILSLEYSVKTVYAWLIGLGSHSVLGAASDYVYATMRLPTETAMCSGGKVIKHLGLNTYVVAIPHEQPFTDCVISITKSNDKSAFVDIAGNKQVLLSYLAPADARIMPSAVTVLFQVPILTEQYQQRVVLLVPVDQLINVIGQLNKNKMSVEHIYDF